jgi:hypothetical protein
VGAVAGRRDPVRAALSGPAGPAGRADTRRAELGEGEDPVGDVLDDVLDPVQLGIARGVGGLLPGLGALEGDAVAGEQAAQGFAADADRPAVDFAQVGDEFA